MPTLFHRGLSSVPLLGVSQIESGEIAMPAQTYLFGCLSDNFGVLLHDPQTGATAAIDAPEAAPIEAALKKTGWRLTDILSRIITAITLPALANSKRIIT